MPLLESIKQYESYLGTSPKMKDFDEFWEKGKEDLSKTKEGYTLQKKDYPNIKDVLVYDLFFEGTFGAKIHCLLLAPKAFKGEGPGVVAFHGHSSNIGSVYSYLPYIYNGISVLAMNVRGQGGLSTDPTNLNGSTVYGQIIKGVEEEDLTKLFYRNVYLDGLKAVRTLMSFDFVDENRIGVMGKSQGGALSLAVSALEEKIKASCVTYPFLCDFKEVFLSNHCDSSYGEFKNYFRKKDPLHKREEDFFNKLSYIDISNFAPNIKSECLWLMALSDDLCHPKTQFAAYNRLKGKKDLLLYPEYSHEPLLYSDDIAFEYFLDRL